MYILALHIEKDFCQEHNFTKHACSKQQKVYIIKTFFLKSLSGERKWHVLAHIYVDYSQNSLTINHLVVSTLIFPEVGTVLSYRLSLPCTIVSDHKKWPFKAIFLNNQWRKLCCFKNLSKH